MRIFLVGALIGLWASAAIACEGQKGKVIFEDTFADDAGGWAFSNPGLVFKAPGAEITIPPKFTGFAQQLANQTFSAGEGDYCLEIAFPQNQRDKQFLVGLFFLSSADGLTYFFAELNKDGVVGLFRHSGDGAGVKLWSADQKANAKLGPGQFNALEAIVRAQVTSGNLKFGIRAEGATDETSDAAFPVKSFKVTEARKLAPDAKTGP
jgi:hypothetical protein